MTKEIILPFESGSNLLPDATSSWLGRIRKVWAIATGNANGVLLVSTWWPKRPIGIDDVGSIRVSGPRADRSGTLCKWPSGYVMPLSGLRSRVHNTKGIWTLPYIWMLRAEGKAIASFLASAHRNLLFISYLRQLNTTSTRSC